MPNRDPVLKLIRVYPYGWKIGKLKIEDWKIKDWKVSVSAWDIKILSA